MAENRHSTLNKHAFDTQMSDEALGNLEMNVGKLVHPGVWRYFRRSRRAALSLIVSVAWLMMMAAVLSACEAPKERETRAAAAAAHDNALARRSVLLEALREKLRNDTTALANLNVLEATMSELAGERPTTALTDWTFIGAVYFSYTLMTTIGYGTFAPVTAAGQALSIVLGVLGIIIFTAFLATAAQ